MFEKLIASDAEGADFKNRRSYFMVSFVVVGVLFLAALVIDIFAADFGLGKGGIELVELLPPVDMAAVEPERPRPSMPATPTHSTSPLPTRQVNMPSLNENPIGPNSVSVVSNTQQSRPNIQFDPGNFDSDPAISNGTGRNNDGTGTGSTGRLATQQVAETSTIPDPPPIIKDPPPLAKKLPVPSLGVINGKATYLPAPPYPAAAKAIGLGGKVDVQVVIDESGKVISAKAVSGNALFSGAAERAAWSARFSPTYLSKVPVKVTGVIVYNFTR